MTKGQCRKCAQRTGARHRGAGGVFSRMVPKPTEEKKSITVANNPNRRRSRWRDAYEGRPRKRPKHGPNAVLGLAAYDPDDEGKIAAHLLKWNEDWTTKKMRDAKEAKDAAARQQATPAFSRQNAALARARRRQPPPRVGLRGTDATPVKGANTALLRLHYHSDRKRELDARRMQSPEATSPVSMHGLAMTAAYAPRGRRETLKRSANEEEGIAAYNRDDEEEIAEYLERQNDAWAEQKREAEERAWERNGQSPNRFSPVSHHGKYQSGQGHRRSMLSQIGSISGLDYGHQAHLQNADLVLWENLTT
jgi:hypothetical protein